MHIYAFVALCLVSVQKSQGKPLRWVTKKQALEYLTKDMTDMAEFRRHHLDPMLIERISGTPANTLVKEFIKTRMQDLGWQVEEDRFEDDTPFGRKTFTNVIATQSPGRAKRVVLACHFDSKDFRTEYNKEFIGAIDSAVPCAILLETAKQLDCLLRKGPRENSVGEELTLQLVFFDGEEAFVHWSSTDSIYGARHLADKWEAESQLSKIRELILLDLIGTKDTRFISHFDSTQPLYEHLMKTEKHLRENGLLSGKHQQTIFTGNSHFGRGGIEDDHIPFLRKGVDVLHLISTPFPTVWHETSDNGSNLDYNLIDDFSRIFRVFVSNLLHLSPENIGCRKK